MGIQKAVEFNHTGITLNYWRLNCVEVDIESNTAICRVGGYVAKADALAGHKAVDNIRYVLSGLNNPINMMTDPREYQTLLYAKILEAGNTFISNKLVGGEIVSDMP